MQAGDAGPVMEAELITGTT